jgi:hypothetical protein
MRFITAPHGDEMRLITAEEVCYFQSDRRRPLPLSMNEIRHLPTPRRR